MKSQWETYWELQEALNAAEDDGLAKRVSPAQPNIDQPIEFVPDASPNDGIDELEWAKKFAAAMR